MGISGQPVELCDDKRGMMDSTQTKGAFEFRTVGSSSRFDLHELS
jgi:hypothetical protein